MSTKAKIGKEWVKCQLVLAETGETLHLTFAPGQARKKVIAHIDGRTDVGWIELAGIAGADAPHDATLGMSLKGEGVRAAPAATAPKAKVPPPAPVVVPAASPEPAPVVAAPVVEETVVTEVQASAATEPAAGAKRGRPKANPARDE